jgi:hypothetical protein
MKAEIVADMAHVICAFKAQADPGRAILALMRCGFRASQIREHFEDAMEIACLKPRAVQAAAPKLPADEAMLNMREIVNETMPIGGEPANQRR